MFSYLHGMRRSAPQNATFTRNLHDRAFPPSDPPQLPPPERLPDWNTSSPVTSDPPILPPIPRVASQHESDRPEMERIERSQTEDTGVRVLSQTNQRPSASAEHQDIRLRGISRSGTMPESSTARERGSLNQEPSMGSPSITRMTAPVQIQRPPTKPIPKPTEVPIPLPQPRRNLSISPPPRKPPLHVKSQANPPRQGKAKLKLLNPMSLLARRRSSQAVAEASRNKHYRTDDTNVPPLRLPDNYDPRIRGKVVHDFDSAPRSGRSGLHSEAGTPPKSSNGQESLGQGQPTLRGPVKDEDSPSSTEKEHTPVFKEHFDDGPDSWQEGREGPMKRPKSGFMYKVALQEPGPRPDPSNLPAFARNLPASFPTDAEPIRRVASPPRAPLEVVLEAALSESLPKDPSIISSPPTSPPKARSRASSNTDLSFTSAGVPIRYKSNASRFSFDLAGVGSAAQEQLLEEKHRQKAKEKARASAESAKSSDQIDRDYDDEGSDYGDQSLDDNGLEEQIPGVNTDAVDESLVAEHFLRNSTGSNPSAPERTAFINAMSPVSEVLSSPKTPQHHQGMPNGLQHPITLSGLNRGPEAFKPEPLTGHGLQLPSEFSYSSANHLGSRPDAQTMPKPLEATLPQRSASYDVDDDMYFDDGMIEDMDEEDGPVFDESQFDDETSRVYGIPIRDLPKPEQAPVSQDNSPVRFEGTESQASPISPDDGTRDEVIAEEIRDSLSELNRTNRPVYNDPAQLTQDNLEAYHDALAFAATQAALNGKFTRQQSLQSRHLYVADGVKDDMDEGPVPVGESPSLEINGLPLSRTLPTNDEYDFDDALSDDAIIAAANAEALENDDEGFYGQEFGFFARANGTGEYANGGFFGQGIMRTHSGRIVEPALTPITERSEWSNRNSAINLALHGYSQVSLPQTSPGLAQLTDMMQLDDDNMSLSALLKLRRGAWGGSASTTSLQSSSGTSGSPLTYMPSMPPNVAPLQYQQQQGMGDSTYSLNSSNGNSSGSDNSHTVTLKTLPGIAIPPGSGMTAPCMQPSYSNSGSDSSPVQSRPRSGLVPVKAKGDSRRGSGESVSYVYERDEDGDRWVLEKRRVGEGGIVEVLGREVVEGGRI